MCPSMRSVGQQTDNSRGENKMEISGVLMIGLMTYLTTCVHSTSDARAFLDNKEGYVTTIVNQAEKINANANICDYVSSITKCSRRECHPILKEEGVACVSIVNNSVCSGQSNTVCDFTQANFDMSYVRTPPLNLSFAGEVGAYLGSTIRAQQHLDPTFIEIHKNISNDPVLSYFHSLYIGDVQGSFRLYPGREVAHCDKYDPRIRPWYIGAISIVKDVVLLIDTGYGSSTYNAISVTGNSTTPLEGAMAITKGLLYTLTNNDRVTIIPFDEKSSPKVANPPTYLVGNTGLQDPATDDHNFKLLVEFELHSADFSPSASESSLPSNYTTAFAQALSVFNRPNPNVDSLKIVILLTYIDNSALSSDVLKASSMFGNKSQTEPRLLVYELGDNKTSSNFQRWRDITSKVGGYNERLNALDVITDPLASLHAYFSFMARSRRDYYNGRNFHFWQNRYKDATSLGWVMTVALPVFSSKNDLVGVAALDFQTDSLDDNLERQIVDFFSNDGEKAWFSPKNASGANFSPSYGGSYKYDEHWNTCPSAPFDDTVFCAKDDFESTYLSLTCCGACALGSPKSNGVWIAVGLASAGAIFLAVLCCFIVKKCWIARKRKQTQGEYLYEELRRGTRNFHKKRKISRGLFGVVYRASLRGERAAVQVLERVSPDRAGDFHAQFETGGIASHPNVVRLKGVCLDSPDTRFFLVYELVEHGDLQSWLFPENPTQFLTWPQRKKIAWGISKGLNHLHNGLLQTRRIFHLDIKPHNILLDENCNSKIADFCVSQLYESVHTYRTVSATFSGHWPPEVLLERPPPNAEMDVYSFGMVLLQLVSGRKVDDPDLPSPNLLLPWARKQTEHGNAATVTDNRMIHELTDEYSMETVRDHCLQLINLALRCLSVDPNARPEMDAVCHIINSLCSDDRILESTQLNVQCVQR